MDQATDSNSQTTGSETTQSLPTTCLKNYFIQVNPKDFIECHICAEFLNDGVICCAHCSKWIHKHCWLRQIGRTKKCPFCSHKKYRTLNEIEQAIQFQLKVECQGCKNVIPMMKIGEHQKTCLECESRCEHCEKKVLNKNILKHLKNQCICRKVKCKDCHEEMTFVELRDDHICPEKTYKCQHCKQDILNKQKLGHPNICLKYPIDCHHCGGKYPREEEKNHGMMKCLLRCSLCKQNHPKNKSGEHGKTKCVFKCMTCKFWGTKGKLGEHLVSHRIFCNTCLNYVSCGAFLRHKKFCNWVKCEHCHLKVLKKQLGTHKSVCLPQNLKVCPNCQIRVFKEDLNLHLETCNPSEPKASSTKSVSK